MYVCGMFKREEKERGKWEKRAEHIPEKPAQAKGLEYEICSY